MTPAEVLAALLAGDDVPRPEIRTAVKDTLRRLTDAAPGRSVEIRIPPVAAVQAVPGAEHRRGTPPAVVQTDPATWLALALGELTWADAVAEGRVQASGARSDLGRYLPLRHPGSGSPGG